MAGCGRWQLITQIGLKALSSAIYPPLFPLDAMFLKVRHFPIDVYGAQDPAWVARQAPSIVTRAVLSVAKQAPHPAHLQASADWVAPLQASTIQHEAFGHVHVTDHRRQGLFTLVRLLCLSLGLLDGPHHVDTFGVGLDDGHHAFTCGRRRFLSKVRDGFGHIAQNLLAFGLWNVPARHGEKYVVGRAVSLLNAQQALQPSGCCRSNAAPGAPVGHPLGSGPCAQCRSNRHGGFPRGQAVSGRSAGAHPPSVAACVLGH
jgi:hypothetical protein